MREYFDIGILNGKTLSSVEVNRNGDDGDEILFFCTDGDAYKMYHDQECCEDVRIEDICGDINELVGSPIVLSEEISSHDEEGKAKDEWDDSYTWTFYKIANNNTYITIRWYGSSNGYYSESVEFIKVD